MKVEFLGPVREGGGALVVLSGAPAYAGVVWNVASGSGTLTPTAARADAAGTATARYEATGDAEGTSVQVEASAYA